MFTDKVMYSSFIHVMFSYIPFSFSDWGYPEVTNNQMQCTVNLNRIWISLSLNIVGNILDGLIVQLNKIQQFLDY